MSGYWIVFEGLDGAGTTTQVKLLEDSLQKSNGGNKLVRSTAEPTHGPFGEICRSALRGQITLDRHTLALAFTADRSQHIFAENGIMEFLASGGWVIQDRYLYSTLAYQDGADQDWLIALHSIFPRPDLLFFLDTPVKECLSRIRLRGGERELFEQAETLEAVQASYRRILKQAQLSHPVVFIDGTGSPDVIHRRVLDEIHSRLDLI